MSKIYSKQFFVVFICVTLALTFNPYVFGYLFGNGSGKGFCGSSQNADGTQPPGVADAVPAGCSIETSVNEGGGHFLHALSLSMAILGQVERTDLQNIDYELLKLDAAAALKSIRDAGRIYSGLVSMAENTPYNPEVAEKLKAFNYKAFMKKNKLKGKIFTDVADHLSKGDITGLYRIILLEISSLEILLADLYKGIAPDRLPRLQLLWQIGEAFSNTYLYGQYMARIFYAL